VENHCGPSEGKKKKKKKKGGAKRGVTFQLFITVSVQKDRAKKGRGEGKKVDAVLLRPPYLGKKKDCSAEEGEKKERGRLGMSAVTVRQRKGKSFLTEKKGKPPLISPSVWSCQPRRKKKKA